ncbi:hypothetical protein SAMN04488005_0019 [Yoonia tamlensis]|uniref:Uncharacterized protein n=1 Tax=Yoonia tamlensis TaxID=390270 RepID=A0A1I6FN91_9RHOB|nr:hypothetical protein [Yoonia tamlensis]SFR31396.1 hypothetical protein SAMN04488005_0019 [Yoonia tamlensis]
MFNRNQLLRLLFAMPLAGCSIGGATIGDAPVRATQLRSSSITVLSAEWQDEFDLRYNYEIINNGNQPMCFIAVHEGTGEIRLPNILEVIRNEIGQPIELGRGDPLPEMVSEGFVPAQSVLVVEPGERIRAEGLLLGDVLPAGNEGQPISLSLTAQPVHCVSSTSEQASLEALSSGPAIVHLTQAHKQYVPTAAAK